MLWPLHSSGLLFFKISKNELSSPSFCSLGSSDMVLSGTISSLFNLSERLLSCLWGIPPKIQQCKDLEVELYYCIKLPLLLALLFCPAAWECRSIQGRSLNRFLYSSRKLSLRYPYRMGLIQALARPMITQRP